jgi:hypothetical protein
MATVGTSAATLTVRATAKRLSVVGDVWHREAVTLAVANAGVAAGNLLLLVYRGSTLVASAAAFTGTTASASGTVNLDSAALATVMEDIARSRDVRLTVRLWDSTTGDLLAEGDWFILSSGDAYGSETSTELVTVVPGLELAYEEVDGVQCVVIKKDGAVWQAFRPPGS